MPEIFGKNVKPQTLALAGGGTVILGLSLYRVRKQNAANAAATAAANAAAQAPGTGAGTSDGTDPATGFPYGSAEDAAALTAQAGYISPTDYLSSGGGSGGYGGGYYPQQFTSNAAWAQAAEQYMTSVPGADATAIGNALGKYITGQPVTPDMQSLIDQAIAFEGYPPVAGPNGFPPSVNTANPGSTGSDGNSGHPTPTPTGTVPATPGNVHVVKVGSDQVGLAWNAVPGATSYRIRATYQGNLAGQGFPTSPGGTIHNLTPNHTYTFHVAAVNAAGTSLETNGPAVKTTR
jgi:hypothetical protein